MIDKTSPSRDAAPTGEARVLRHRSGALTLGERTLVMGIVNVTPDSFSDRGLHFDAADAVAGAQSLATEGADLIDIGAESTRPGHTPVPVEEEWRRLEPVLTGLATQRERLPAISVDTTKASVAKRALEAGASLVNDVWGFQRDPDLPSIAAECGAGAVLMHNRESIDTTIDILDDIRRFLERSVAIARRAGVPDDRIVLDPGIGFGKTLQQNLEAIAGLGKLKALGFPLLLGVSRKSFIGRLVEPQPPASARLPGTIAANAIGAIVGADIVRVHDVAAHVQAMRVADALARISTFPRTAGEDQRASLASGA